MTQKTSEPTAMLFLGLLAGAAGALLLAPRSGRETREKVKEVGRKWQDDAARTRDTAAEKVKDGLDKVSSQVSEKADKAATKVDTLKTKAKKDDKSDTEYNRATPYADAEGDIV
jgi:gas vesicle protein